MMMSILLNEIRLVWRRHRREKRNTIMASGWQEETGRVITHWPIDKNVSNVHVALLYISIALFTMHTNGWNEPSHHTYRTGRRHCDSEYSFSRKSPLPTNIIKLILNRRRASVNLSPDEAATRCSCFDGRTTAELTMHHALEPRLLRAVTCDSAMFMYNVISPNRNNKQQHASNNEHAANNNSMLQRIFIIRISQKRCVMSSCPIASDTK